MNILYFVDIHGNTTIFNKLSEYKPKIDLIVVGGDITNFGSKNQAIKILKKAYETFQKPIVFVPGNCDDKELLTWDGDANILPAHGKIIEVKGLKIGGVGGSTITPFNTYIEFAENEMLSILNNLRNKNINVFVTHSPPLETKLDRIYSGMHVGSLEIRKFIEEQKPKIVLTGHIHEASGIDYVEETPIVNPGPASYGNYAIISLGEKIEIKINKIH